MTIVDADVVSEIAWRAGSFEDLKRKLWMEIVDTDFVRDAYGYTWVSEGTMYLCGGRAALMVAALRLAGFSAPEVVDMEMAPYMCHPGVKRNSDRCVNLFRDTVMRSDQIEIVATGMWWDVLLKYGKHVTFVDEAAEYPVASIEAQYTGLWLSLLHGLQRSYEVFAEHRCPWVMRTLRVTRDCAWLVMTARAALWLAMRCLEFAQEIEACGRAAKRVRKDLVLVYMDAQQYNMMRQSASEAEYLSELVSGIR